MIERYTPSLEKEWNDFNRVARNATFLTDRGYMDYHSDRFIDHSLIVRKNGKILALLPANISPDNVLHSHQGLTYGGWILPPRHIDASAFLKIWNLLKDYCKENSISGIDYKPLPYIFATAPSGEDKYALFLSGAKLTECNLSATIKLSSNPGFDKGRKRLLRKSEAVDCNIEEVNDSESICEFYSVLCDCLDERHYVKPVHSLSEINLLLSRFPDNIRLWVVRVNGVIEAGCILYLSNKVAHCQYIASTKNGRNLSLLSRLFYYLIGLASIGKLGKDIEYFDFGTNNEDHGLYLNAGLYEQKFSMGATGVPFERFYIKI